MKKQSRLYRVVAFLSREELDCLDELAKDIYFTHGVKIPRTKLIEAIIREFSEQGPEGKKVLMNRIVCAAHTKTERRKYPRLNRDLLIGFRTLDSLEQYKNCATENLSLGGFKLDVPFSYAPPQVEQVIELAIKGHEEGLEPIKAIGRVVWMKEKENKQGFEIGVMLTYIKKEDRGRFVKYLNKGTETQTQI